MRDWDDKYHVWGTPRGHLPGQTRENSNTSFFHTKKEHVYIYVVYVCRIISCLKGFNLFCHIHTYIHILCRDGMYMDGMFMSLEIY